MVPKVIQRCTTAMWVRYGCCFIIRLRNGKNRQCSVDQFEQSQRFPNFFANSSFKPVE